MKGLFRVILPLLLLFLMISCARQGTPAGGERDSEAPILISVSPEAGTINFKETEVVFTFNEYVRLDNINQQLIISPALEKDPDFKIKKRSIIMVLKTPLDSNTTYNFNFGNAIVDVNEGNPLKDFTYVISTGTYVDSLKLGGKVINAYSSAPVKDITVMVYDTSANDSTPFKKKPNYISKTNALGEFKLNNLKSGQFKVIAVSDANKDLKYQPSEEIAFTEELQSSDTAYTRIGLRLFRQMPAALEIVSKKLEEQRKLTIGISQECESCKLVEPAGQNFIFSNWKDANSDSLYAQLTRLDDRDSLVFFLQKDSIVDTAVIYPGKVKKVDPKPLSFYPEFNGLAEGGGPAYFSFLEPIINIDKADSVRIMRKDSTFFYTRLKADSLKIKRYYLDFIPEYQSSYTVYWPDSSFFTLYDNYNAQDTLAFGVQKLEFYGNLSFNVDNELKEPAILLFTNGKDGSVIQRKLNRGKNKVDFLLLEPGKYSVSVIVDENGNGKWDAGNYLQKVQPETVINFKEAVEVRSNWEMELDWKLELSDIK